MAIISGTNERRMRFKVATESDKCVMPDIGDSYFVDNRKIVANKTNFDSIEEVDYAFLEESMEGVSRTK